MTDSFILFLPDGAPSIYIRNPLSSMLSAGSTFSTGMLLEGTSLQVNGLLFGP